MQAVLKKTTEKKVTRCAIYCRVSTDQQAEVEFNSCEAQEDRIRSFIASQDGFTASKVYSDPGYTGANLNRPGLKQMLADVEAGALDMVITYKIDRLTRSPRDFYQLIESLESRHVGYISVTERFDTSTPAGRLLRNIMLTFAQFERELASERIRDKCAQKAQRGLYNGGKPPVGYIKEGGKLRIEPKRAAVVRYIFEKYSETRCAHQVTLALRDRWHDRRLPDSFVLRVLKNPATTGKVLYKGKVYPGQHEPIISEELFNHVQTLMVQATRKSRLPSSPYHALPYAGLIQCVECGSSMSPTHTDKTGPSGQRRYHYYRCTSTNHRGWRSCGTRQISADRLDDMIYRNLLRISMDPLYLRNHVFALKNVLHNPYPKGIEPHPISESLTPEIVQNSLQAYVKACARKTGIEKALAVRHGIEKVFYSRDMITVRFRCSHASDGKEGRSENLPAAERNETPPLSSAALKSERPVSDLESGPSFKLERLQNVELKGIEPSTSSLRTTRSPS
jgi:site-specific DNA recombinase